MLSCRKDKPAVEPPKPAPVQMEYFNLYNREIKRDAPGFVPDLNHDGRTDLAFTTLLVGDHVNQLDKLQFLIFSNISVNLAVNLTEEIPVMNKGQIIVTGNFDGYQWFELSPVVLLQKIISFVAPPVWEGHWKSATNK